MTTSIRNCICVLLALLPHALGAFTLVAIANLPVNSTARAPHFVRIDPTTGKLVAPFVPAPLIGTSYVDPLTHIWYISSFDPVATTSSLRKFSSVAFNELGEQKYFGATVGDLRMTGNGSMLVGIVMSSPGFAFVHFQPNNELRVLRLMPTDYFPWGRGAACIDHDNNIYWALFTRTSTEQQFLVRFQIDRDRVDMFPLTGFTEYLISYPPYKDTPRMVLGVRWPAERFVGTPQFVSFDRDTGKVTVLADFPPQMPRAIASGCDSGVVTVLALAPTSAAAHLVAFDVPNKTVRSIATYDEATALQQMWHDWQ